MRRALLSGMLFAVLCVPSSAGAVNYAPVDRPGPALSVDAAKLAAALECSAGVVNAGRAPVLLVPGTGVEPRDNWEWNYEPALDAEGIPWCTINLPEHTTADVQIAGEYLVYAIRTMHSRAGRRISIIGHSQGGMVPRWALRFWPDTRAMVDDDIGFAATNHGTTMARSTCNPTCSAATWQQRDDSMFTAALNSGQESFPGISYTEVYTHTDEIVTPNADDNGSSSIHGGGGLIENQATQDTCPNDIYEHLMVGTIDPVAYALALDALNNPGPADPTRIPISVCAEILLPGLTPITATTRGGEAAYNLQSYQSKPLPAEPELRCYVLAGGCPAAGSAVAATKVKARCKRKKKRRRHKHAGTARKKKHKKHCGAKKRRHRKHAKS